MLLAFWAPSSALALQCAAIDFDIRAQIVDVTTGRPVPGAQGMFYWNRRDHPATGPGPQYQTVFEADQQGQIGAGVRFFYKGVWGPFGGHCTGKPKRLRVSIAVPGGDSVVQVFKLRDVEVGESENVRIVELPPIGVPAT